MNRSRLTRLPRPVLKPSVPNLDRLMYINRPAYSRESGSRTRMEASRGPPERENTICSFTDHVVSE